MNLSFSTKWPERMGDLAGKPNFFIEKIWSGLRFDDPRKWTILHSSWLLEHKILFGKEWDNEYPNIARPYAPKHHTIRYDPHDRWKPGMKIHPIINNRTKDRFQFAPVLKTKSTQKIEIENMGYWQDNGIWIDGRELSLKEMKQVALNDGFPSIEAFFNYFNEDLGKGWKIIHWTDLKY